MGALLQGPMMAEPGYIKLSRKLFAKPSWTRVPFDRFRAWIDLIQLAAWQVSERTVGKRKVTLGRGQFCLSLRFLAKRWQWPIPRVQRFLSGLEKADQIAIHLPIHIAIHLPPVYRIVNYSTYQTASGLSDTPTDTPTDTSRKAVKAVKQQQKQDPIPAGQAVQGKSGGPRATWMTPYAQVWEAKKGVKSFDAIAGEVAKYLWPIHAEVGPEKLAKHLANYLKRTPTEYAKIKNFASGWAGYASSLTTEQQAGVDETMRMFGQPVSTDA